MKSADMTNEGCKCQRCGFNYIVDLNISNDLWNKICKTYTLLCGSCIMQLIEDIGDYNYFYLGNDFSQKKIKK